MSGHLYAVSLGSKLCLIGSAGMSKLTADTLDFVRDFLLPDLFDTIDLFIL